jgi:ElaB/YqjD/DUF883 family membrane-anchored ribosome-binding protein
MKTHVRRLDEMTTDALRADVTQVDARARALLRERPLLAVAAALGIGYALGRVVARR